MTKKSLTVRDSISLLKSFEESRSGVTNALVNLGEAAHVQYGACAAMMDQIASLRVRHSTQALAGTFKEELDDAEKGALEIISVCAFLLVFEATVNDRRRHHLEEAKRLFAKCAEEGVYTERIADTLRRLAEKAIKSEP